MYGRTLGRSIRLTTSVGPARSRPCSRNIARQSAVLAMPTSRTGRPPGSAPCRARSSWVGGSGHPATARRVHGRRSHAADVTNDGGDRSARSARGRADARGRRHPAVRAQSRAAGSRGHESGRARALSGALSRGRARNSRPRRPRRSNTWTWWPFCSTGCTWASIASSSRSGLPADGGKHALGLCEGSTVLDGLTFVEIVSDLLVCGDHLRRLRELSHRLMHKLLDRLFIPTCHR